MTRPLVIAPSLPLGVGRPGQVRTTGKFLSGIQSFVELWDGPVKLLAEPDESPGSGNLDDMWVDLKSLPFEVEVARFDTDSARAAMRSARLVLGGTDHRLNGAASDCARHKVPYVVVTEPVTRSSTPTTYLPGAGGGERLGPEGRSEPTSDRWPAPLAFSAMAHQRSRRTSH